MQKRHGGLEKANISIIVILSGAPQKCSTYAEHKNTSHNGRVLRRGKLAICAGEEALVPDAAGNGGGANSDALGRHFRWEIISVFSRRFAIRFN